MTRPSELTRHSLIEAATTVFAEKGYEGGSVRLITQKAKANQRAIRQGYEALGEALKQLAEQTWRDQAGSER